MNKKPQIFLNEKVLKFRDILVIGPEGNTLGVMQSRQALQIAQTEGLDLMVVNHLASPIVCKILDYGKFKYQENKKLQANQKPKQETKEIKVSPKIQLHDIITFVNRAKKFLEHGDKVKVTCVFKAREIEHPELGLNKINIVLDLLKDLCVIESEPSLKGKVMSCMLNPKC
jgi:translation initiation factor IF-3